MTEQQEVPRPQHVRPPLRRSKSDRVIAGVCGGVARSLDIDPVIVRVLVAAFALAGGAGIIAYLIAWIVIPDDDGQSVVEDARTHGGRGRKFLLAVVLAVLGLGAVASLTGGDNGTLAFLVFVVLGVVVWQAFGADWFEGPRPATTATSSTGTAPGVEREPASMGAPVAAARNPRSVLGLVVFNAVLVALGVMILLNFAGATALSARAMFGICLGLVGAGLVASAFVGRARGLIALGLVIGMLAVPAGFKADGTAGTRSWIPVAAAGSTSASYDLGVGDATLDLRSAVPQMSPSDTLDITAHVSLGQLIVLLPTDSAASYRIHVQDNVGDIEYPGQFKRSGINNSTDFSLGDATSGPIVNLDLHVNVGHLEVRYA